MPGESKTCAVPSCLAKNKTLEKFGVILNFFPFPRDEIIRSEWLLKCNKSLSELLESDAVCSRHFHTNDFLDGIEAKMSKVKPIRLKPDAVPSLCLESRQRRSRKNLVKQCSDDEYHKILAQEILHEEKYEAVKLSSSDSPVYLEFSQKQKLVQQVKRLKSLTQSETEVAIVDNNKLAALDITVENVTPQSDQNPVRISHEIRKFKVLNCNKADNQVTGHCYVCNKAIRECDRKNFSRDDFTRIVQNVLTGISSEYVIVTTDNDGLCGACCNIVSRISKLEADLRTATLGLRALLRLNYSLPLPVPTGYRYIRIPDTGTGPIALQEEPLPEKVRSKSDLSLSESPAENENFTMPIKSDVRKKHILTQTSDVQKIQQSTQTSSDVRKRHQLTQTKKCNYRNKSTQTFGLSPTDAQVFTVRSVNGVKYLEALDYNIFNSANEIKYLKAGDLQKHFDGTDYETENCMFEDITNVAEHKTLLNDHCLAEESEVIIGSSEKSTLESAGQEIPRRPFLFKSDLRLKCSQCTFRTILPEAMKEHMLSFGEKNAYHCNICNFSFHTASKYNKHVQSHSETNQNQLCVFCGALIHDKLHMRFHIEAKHEESPFYHPCLKCNLVFSFTCQMTQHIQSVHKNLNRSTCEKCGKTFGNRVKYKNHVEYHHRSSLNCKYCQKPYPTLRKLSLHENSQHRHQGTGHYQCSYCQEKFFQQELLQQHVALHVFEYRCEKCGDGFCNADYAEKHPESCGNELWLERLDNLGPKRRINPSSLQPEKKRLRGPNSEHQSIVCDVCRECIAQSLYKKHREMHSNPSVHQCNMCGKRFLYEDHLKTHLKKRHQVEA